jgi:predicted ribosome quality control (RQC) complex YloA/Tae2 family protein
MNATLLARLVPELRAAMAGRTLDAPKWFAPILALPFDRGRAGLVAVLETPGPFCFLADRSPFEGARAPERFERLAGAIVENVSMENGDRVLRIDVRTRTDYAPLNLVITLYGSAGVALLRRDGDILESVGPRRIFEASSREMTAASPARASHADPEETAVAGGGPFILVPGGSPGSASPRVAGRAGRPAEGWGPFNDARSACAHIGALILAEAQAAMLHRIARPVRKKTDVLRRLAINLEADLARAADHEQERREAETLAAYQSRVPNGADLVELPDLYDPERTMRIELDPATPVHVQIEKRFRRATKLAKSVEHTTRRLELARRESAELEAALALLGKTASFAEALKLYEVMRAKFGIALEGGRGPAPGGAKKPATQEKTRRTFDLDAHWFAIVGRSNQENDEITFHVAGPNDWWFHAQGVAGSHVVLKGRGGNDGPPARIIEQAASIAAHFSKARHSGLVPVIYTRRRYVRKFRGAAPGQVTCERETMVMVPPQLPDSGDE